MGSHPLHPGKIWRQIIFYALITWILPISLFPPPHLINFFRIICEKQVMSVLQMSLVTEMVCVELSAIHSASLNQSTSSFIWILLSFFLLHHHNVNLYVGCIRDFWCCWLYKLWWHEICCKLTYWAFYSIFLYVFFPIIFVCMLFIF